MLVNELMSPQPITVEPSCKLKDAIPKMADTASSCLIVVADNKPVGIVTERDVTRLFAEIIEGRLVSDSLISAVMTEHPVCVLAGSLFKEALMLSKSRKLRHLPVIDEQDNLVGVVTQASLVDVYVKLIDEHAELATNLEELRLLALEDPLLGIGNRRAMEVDLNHTQAMAKRHNQLYGVALLDIDSFKKYNDHYGHQTGDEALRQVAQTVKSTLRDSDRVFRYGGEELLILMSETDTERAKLCAERVRQAVESLKRPHIATDYKVLTVSIGVAALKVDSWEMLVQRADEALYVAKSQGRNCVVVDPASV
jgi:diguanylate cyclase (GGDEF)-like protein